MGKVSQRVRGQSQKTIVKILEGLSGRFSLWEVWQDFIIMCATSLANAVDGRFREAREKDYMARVSKYTSKELDSFGQAFAEVVMALEENPDQDFLGELFMCLDLGNEWKGQFFTPYSVCKAMAEMTFPPGLVSQIEDRGWVSVSDPACGAGALLIAFANMCRQPGRDVNFQTQVLFVAQDIDYLASMMCYIQLSLLGCPGYVVIDDTLAHPSTSYDCRGLIPTGGSNVWYTPMYFREVWHWRRLGAQMEMIFKDVPSVKSPKKLNPKGTPNPLLHTSENKNGQLSLF